MIETEINVFFSTINVFITPCIILTIVVTVHNF